MFTTVYCSLRGGDLVDFSCSLRGGDLVDIPVRYANEISLILLIERLTPLLAHRICFFLAEFFSHGVYFFSRRLFSRGGYFCPAEITEMTEFFSSHTAKNHVDPTTMIIFARSLFSCRICFFMLRGNEGNGRNRIERIMPLLISR